MKNKPVNLPLPTAEECQQRGYTEIDFYRLTNMWVQPHLLIAGATGSGKSVLINDIIYTMLYLYPYALQLILIDPKRVELGQYRKLPHTLRHATEPDTILNALNYAMVLIERRYKTMKRLKVKEWPGGHVYIIIDELADLMTTNKKEILPLLQRIGQIGRAARVHMIAATQCPLASVIPTPLKVNFDARVGLRTRSAQDSRNILGCNGCEQLPRYGKGYYMIPEGISLIDIPYIKEDEIQIQIDLWRKHRSMFR